LKSFAVSFYRSILGLYLSTPFLTLLSEWNVIMTFNPGGGVNARLVSRRTSEKDSYSKLRGSRWSCLVRSRKERAQECLKKKTESSRLVLCLGERSPLKELGWLAVLKVWDWTGPSRSGE
jgi:hypothetical protein